MPAEDELSQAWETAAGADQRAYHRMVWRHGLHAPWLEIGDGRYFTACAAHADLNGVPGIPVGEEDQPG